MELDALAQLDGHGLAVSADRWQRLCQKRRHAPLLVECIERLEYVLGNDAYQVGGGRHRIERRRLTNGGDVDHAPLFLRHEIAWRGQQKHGSQGYKFQLHRTSSSRIPQ